MADSRLPQSVDKWSTPRAEFRDMRPGVQYVLGGIGGGGLAATIGCLKMAWAGNPIFIYVAIAVALCDGIALAVVYLQFGRPCILRQFENGLVLTNGKKESWIPFDSLTGFTANWVDVHRNGVYSHTHVSFGFLTSDNQSVSLKYHSSAGYGSTKYENLQRFQNDVVPVVSRRMLATLRSEGSVEWTSRISILPNALALAGKYGGDSQPIEFSRITRWQVDQGLFKLAVDGEKKPSLIEKTSRTNFFPGLVLFEQLASTESNVELPEDEQHALACD